MILNQNELRLRILKGREGILKVVHEGLAKIPLRPLNRIFNDSLIESTTAPAVTAV